MDGFICNSCRLVDLLNIEGKEPHWLAARAAAGKWNDRAYTGGFLPLCLLVDCGQLGKVTSPVDTRERHSCLLFNNGWQYEIADKLC